MNKKQLSNALCDTHFRYENNFSNDCIEVLKDILHDEKVEELSQDSEIEDLEDFSDILWSILDNCVIYYEDNWNYLKEYGDTDFETPFKEGFTTISQLHYYYLEQEVYEAIRAISKC